MNYIKFNLGEKYLYFLFFLLGLNNFIFYIPAAIIYLILINKTWGVRRSFLIYLFLNLIAILFIFILGYDRMPREDPLRLFIALVVLTVLAGYLIQNHTSRVQANMLSFYILGLGLHSSIIAGYSYIFNDGNYGYGNLFNPFSHEEVNSPTTSNNLALFAAMIIFYIFNNKSKALKAIMISLLFSIVVLALFLGGRAFFILLFTALTYSILRPLSIKKIYAIIVLFILFTTLGSYYINYINIDFVLERLQKGFESSRFLHYQHGFNELISNPLGGYTIDQSIEKTNWFHNIFLDMGRLGGWIAVGSFSLSLIYVMIKSTKKIININTNLNFAFLIFLISFLILQQDISLEGDYRPYIAMFLSAIMLLCSPQNKHT